VSRTGAFDVRRALPWLLVAVGVSTCLSLGTWQLNRAAEKRALLAAYTRGDAPAVAYGSAGAGRYAHVNIEGAYETDRQILLDNMTHDGRVGYRVLTPLRTSLGVVLVDRGWIAAPARRDALPDITVDGSVRTVTGRLDLLPRPGIVMAPDDGAGWPRRLNYPDDAAIRRILGPGIEPGVVLLDPGAADGYLRDWHPGGLPPERHVGYAVQWFALALTLLILFAVRRRRRRDVS
jgi:surfeit locus 1 family protein